MKGGTSMNDDKKQLFDFDIDISELEKIKNSKTSKKDLEGMNVDVTLFEDEQQPEFIEDEFFLKNLDAEIERFNSSLSSRQLKEVKKILKEHNHKQKVIVLQDKKPETKLQSTPPDSTSLSENLDDLMNDFKTQIIQHQTIKTKTRPQDNKRQFNKLIKKHHESPSIDESLLNKDLDDLLAIKLICVWINHSQARFKERVAPNYSEDEKNKINEFLIDKFTNEHLNDKQEYELRYRTSDVRTFKIVAFKNGQYVFIKTLYRIDKDSKQEYIESKHRYRK